MDNKMIVVNRDGDRLILAVGDWVCFKSDIEQSGRIVGFQQSRSYHLELLLENPNGFDGGYIGGETRTSVLARDVWVE
jgi:hypothetical protein